MRVAIVENTRVTHHGQVGVALHEAAAKIDLYKPFAGQPLPDSPDGFDALVVFGGEQSALDDTTHPYLPRLAALMRQASQAGRAVLGICLGAQVLARGFGAENRLGATPEFGWRDVRLTEDGRNDPLLGSLGAAFPIFQWHADTFTLPEGATHLALSDAAPAQAFRIGRATWGTQFHFEASRAVVADWARTFPEAVARQDAGFAVALPDLAATRGAQADAAGLAIARAFVAQV
ncbi:MAG TPA: type 1 glutamine amidotransferase [Paracoccaceae bacterium]|nr:type 1 glutamine amidotransferase [Paracoccaceae bacterium]